jgi:hypothetical protein
MPGGLFDGLVFGLFYGEARPPAHHHRRRLKRRERHAPIGRTAEDSVAVAIRPTHKGGWSAPPQRLVDGQLPNDSWPVFGGAGPKPLPQIVS